ncbi:unnamed protein product, partial [Brassica oleracea var. botrytis]
EHVKKQRRKIGTVDELIQVITPKGRGEISLLFHSKRD